MQKVVDIKILKVEWKNADLQEVAKYLNEKVENWWHLSEEQEKKFNEHATIVGMDKATNFIETQIKDYLAKGWQMKGEINYVTFQVKSDNPPVTAEEHRRKPRNFITQTMVKYETTTLVNDLFTQ